MSFKNKIFFPLLVALICSCKANHPENDKLVIVTTTSIIGDCISSFTDSNVQVISIMGAGVDPHLYKASQGDLDKLSKADIIIYNGLHLEGKMAQVLSKIGANKISLAVGSYADEARLKRVDNTSELHDPHIWFNPILWMDCMHGVANELAKQPGLENIVSMFEEYKSKVLLEYESLQADLDKKLPVKKRILITSHDAFNYYGDAFNFKVRGLQGISTAAEYGIKDVSELIEFIIQNDVQSIFIETSVSDKNLKSVVEGANAQGYNVKIGGTLFSDALGETNTPGGSYIGMIKTNTETIIAGLQ